MLDADRRAAVHGWGEGTHSVTMRFEERDGGAITRVAEVEVFDHDEAEVRLLDRVSNDVYEVEERVRCGNADEALYHAVEAWGVTVEDRALTEVRADVLGAE